MTPGARPPATGALTITLFIPGKLTNPKNGSRGHWTRPAAWAAEWRRKTRLAWLEAGRPTLDGWAHVQLTMHVARLWDRSNLALGSAPVLDEAMYLMCQGAETRATKDGRMQRVAPDGPQHGHLIEITQAVRPEYRGVLITVAPR